jgi:deazaflavin-dependent oxidoreductase (nitroreductase family)
MTDHNTLIIEEFRSTGGRVGGFFEGAPLLLLHHTGAKTATERISPLMSQGLREGYAIFASKEGAPSNPDWFHNLLANPDVTVEVGSETIEVTARVAEGAEAGADLDSAEGELPALRRVRGAHRSRDTGRDPRAPLTPARRAYEGWSPQGRRERPVEREQHSKGERPSPEVTEERQRSMLRVARHHFLCG